MARINNFPNDPNISGGDKLVGTDVIGGATNNFTIDDIAQYLAELGDADPNRNAFPFTYAGEYNANDILLAGQFRYEFTGSTRGPAQVQAIIVANATINGIDFTSLTELLTRTSIKVSGVDTSDDRRFAYYSAGAITTLQNGSGLRIPVTHISSNGSLATDKINIGLSGSAIAGQTVIVGHDGGGIFSGTEAPENNVMSPAGAFYIQFDESTDGIRTNYRIYGPKVGGTEAAPNSTGWGTQTILRGAQGDQGDQGDRGDTGRPGTNGVGITSVIRTAGDGSAGTTDTYTITLTNGLTTNFQVVNGSNGRDAVDGVGITSVVRTAGDGSAGTTDTYTITFTNGLTTDFQVVNGLNGTNAVDGNGIATSSYDSDTGIVTLTFTDGSSFDTGDLRGTNGREGTDGNQGPQGVYRVEAFTRSATRPADIVNLVYTIATQALSGTDSTTWSLTVPTGTDQVWESITQIDPSTGALSSIVWGAPFEAGGMGPTGPEGPRGVSIDSITSADAATGGTDVTISTDNATAVPDVTFNIPDGTTGATGARGSMIFRGAGTDNVPDAGVATGAVDGDFFLNAGNSTIYGPYASGAFPVAGVDLTGRALDIPEGTTLPLPAASIDGDRFFLTEVSAGDPPGLYDYNGTTWTPLATNTSTFLSLTDTPGTYPADGQVPIVGGTGTRLEFTDDIVPVEANVATPTADLTTIRIGTTVYRLRGGGAAVPSTLSLVSNYDSDVFSNDDQDVTITATADSGGNTFTSVEFFTGTVTTGVPDATISTASTTNEYTHTYTGVTGGSNVYTVRFTHDGASSPETETITLTRNKIQPGAITYSGIAGTGALARFVHTGNRVESGATGTITATANGILNDWTSSPVVPFSDSVTVPATGGFTLSESFSFTGPSGSSDIASDQTPSETFTRVFSARIGYLPSATIDATMINTLSNWDLGFGDITAAEINAATYRVATEAGNYTYFLIPSVFTTAVFMEGPFSINLTEQAGGAVAGYRVFRSPNQARIPQNLIYTINVS